MTREEEQLLLKDLCARLPYNVVIRCTDNDTDYECFLTTVILNELLYSTEYYDYKPYLRPMASMTPQEWIELCDAGVEDEKSAIFIKGIRKFVPCTNRENFLNSKHFDHHNLIEKGLALEAPEGMYTA